MKIKAGEILILSHGEYSDYGFDGPFKVIREFDQAELSEEFLKDWRQSGEPEWGRPGEFKFIAWLSKAGYIEDLASHNWHIGSYYFDPVIQ